jgi:hypothetical protein
MTLMIGDGEKPADEQVCDGPLLPPARRRGVATQARQCWMLPSLALTGPTRFAFELAVFAVGFAVLRFTSGAAVHITISGYLPLWPALPLLLLWKAINRILKP